MGPPPPPHQVRPDLRRIWLSPRAIAMHLTLLVVVPAFIGLFWWQVQRVRQGNTLSWAYVFEWPFFTGYAVYMWWKLVHDQALPTEPASRVASEVPAVAAVEEDPGEPPEAPPPSQSHVAADQSRAEREDEELAAYNRYLAQLDASGRRKHW